VYIPRLSSKFNIYSDMSPIWPWPSSPQSLLERGCEFLYMYNTHLSTKLNTFQSISTWDVLTLTQYAMVNSPTTIRKRTCGFIYVYNIYLSSTVNTFQDIIIYSRFDHDPVGQGQIWQHHLNASIWLPISEYFSRYKYVSQFDLDPVGQGQISHNDSKECIWFIIHA
jgi:hypothetical protein